MRSEDINQLFTRAEAALGPNKDDGERIIQIEARLKNGTWIQFNRPTVVASDRKRDKGHSPDFRCVRWNGYIFSFSGGQAAVVRLLWEAWENETPEVSGDYLLTEAGLESNRLDSLFRHHPAFLNLIVRGSRRGVYRLNDLLIRPNFRPDSGTGSQAQ